MTENLVGLGRRRARDDRDRQHLMGRAPAGVSSREWHVGPILDQGNTAQCVAFAGMGWLTCGPVVNRHPAQTPEDIYRRCLVVDEFPGEDWEGGTSVRALFKTLKEWGYIREYQWAFDAQTVVAQILARGPVVVGTNWYMDMFTPLVGSGYLEVGGDLAGGHAYLLSGAEVARVNPGGTRGAVRVVNSWGPGWGERGRAWLALADLDRLLKEDGEAGVAVEVDIS